MAWIARNTGLSGTALNVNWILQNPATRHLNSTSHELWIATDAGIFHSINGGRSWAKIILPDPSNAEFSDSPAATVDELTFHCVKYGAVNNLIMFVLAAKASSSRIWMYKTTNLWASGTISSRGVTVA